MHNLKITPSPLTTANHSPSATHRNPTIALRSKPGGTDNADTEKREIVGVV